MTLRLAFPADAPALFRLESALFTAADYPLSLCAFRYHIRNGLLLVAEEEGAATGYALALIRGRRSAKLYSLAVTEAAQGRGVATALLESLFGELSTLGFLHIILEVRCDNAAAIVLYGKLGFTVRKHLPSFYRDGCDAYLMAAEIPAAKQPLGSAEVS